MFYKGLNKPIVYMPLLAVTWFNQIYNIFSVVYDVEIYVNFTQGW